MSIRTVEVIILDDSDDDASPRITTTQVAATATSRSPGGGGAARAMMPSKKKKSTGTGGGESMTPSKKIKVHDTNKKSSTKTISSLSHVTAPAASTVVVGSLSLAIAASKPITPSPHPATDNNSTNGCGGGGGDLKSAATGTGGIGKNMKTLVLSPPTRATTIMQFFPDYKTQPREALELLVARFRVTSGNSKSSTSSTAEAPSSKSKSSISTNTNSNNADCWYQMGSGSSLCQLPGLVMGGSPVLLPLQTSYHQTLLSSSTSSSSLAAGETPTHLAFVKNCVTSLTMAHAHLFAPQQGRILECPPEKISFLNPYFNALLESSIGAEACTILLGTNVDELFGSTLQDLSTSSMSASAKRNYTVSVSMKMSGGFFQYSPLSEDIQRYIASQHQTPATVRNNSSTTAAAAVSTNNSVMATTISTSNYSTQITVPIGYVMVFVPSLYTGGTVHFSQKSTVTSTSTATATATTLSSQTSSNPPLSEVEMDINVNGENHFQYRYVTWAYDGDAAIKSTVQIGSLISGCRLCLLYKLDAIIQSDLDVNALTTTIPSFLRCKLHPSDIPNFIHTVVQEWNNYAPFGLASTNISDPEQTSFILFPSDDGEDVSRKSVEDMLNKAIENGTDLDFREGTATYVEKGVLKPNSNTKLASVSSVSIQMSVEVMTDNTRTYTIPNEDIRKEMKAFFKNTAVAATEKLMHHSTENGKRTREPIKCLVLWPRRRTWIVLQAMAGRTGNRTLNSIASCDFSNCLSYLTQRWMQRNATAHIVRNNSLMMELLQWWACHPGHSSNMATRFLDIIVNSKNQDFAKLYITTFLSKTFFEKCSSDRGSMEPISSIFTHGGFLPYFSSLINKDSIFRELGSCQLRHAVNIAVGCYKIVTTGKTKPDIPTLLDEIICHVISLIINEKHVNKKAWYESLKLEFNSLSYDCEAILFLLQFVSLQVDAKKKLIDYGKLGIDVLVTTLKVISRHSTSDDLGSRIGNYSRITDHLLKNNFPAGTIQSLLAGLIEEIEMNQAYTISYSILTSTEHQFFGYHSNYCLLFAGDLIRKIVLKKVSKYPIDSLSITKSLLTRLGSELITTSSGIYQSIRISSFMKALQSESVKRDQCLDSNSRTGLMNLLKAIASKHDNSTGSFSILFDSDMKNFIIFASLVGSDQASDFMKTLIESSNISNGGKLIVDLIRCVLDSQSASVQDLSLTCALLESFLARFIGNASPAHISEICEMLGETSSQKPTLPKNTLSTIIEFKEKAKGKIVMKPGFMSTMETFINVIMLAITHDANNKVKVKIEGSTDRCLAQRIISKSDLESILRAVGIDRLIPFYESFCSTLPIAAAMSFTCEFVQRSEKRRTNISCDDRRAKTSILYLASSSVDAILSIAPDSLIKMELNACLKVIQRVALAKGSASLRQELQTTFDSIPAMAPAVLLSSAIALLKQRVTGHVQDITQQSLKSDDKVSLIEFVEMNCEAWFLNWSTKKNFPDLDKFFTKDSLRSLISFSGFDSVAMSICNMTDQFYKTSRLIPDLLIYFLCSDDVQKQRTILPTFVKSLLECLKPDLKSKEKWAMSIIVLAIFQATNEADLKREWEEAVFKLRVNGTIPIWQMSALGLVDDVFVAKEVPKDNPTVPGDPKIDLSMTTHRVVIPNDVKGGESFMVTVEGLRFKAVCPVGHTPGMSLLIRVPKQPVETPSSTPSLNYELDLLQGVLPNQTINVKVKEDTIIQVICPHDFVIGDKIRFIYNSSVGGPIKGNRMKASELKLPSNQTPAMPKIHDSWLYLLNLIKYSLSSESIISVLDYSEIFMYSTTEKSVQVASYFAEIARHVLNVETGVATVPAAAATATSPMIQSYSIITAAKLNDNDKVGWTNLIDEVRTFLSSHCLKTASIQIPQYKHKFLSQFIHKHQLPVTCSYTQAGNRKWQASLAKTTSVPFNSGGVNMCSCDGQTWCYGNWRSKGPCEAMILNPHLPLERNKPKPAPSKKKIDPDQVRSILTHFETMAKGLEVETEIEIVAPPQRSVALVEVLE